MSMQLLKSLHLLGVVLFLGNIVVTAIWKVAADRTRRPVVIAYAQRLVTITDLALTLPGAVLILLSGHLMAGGHSGIFSASWLTTGWLLFIVSGLLWLCALVPIQVMQSRLARGFRDQDSVPPRYWRLATAWSVVGSIATILPLANLYFMVFKPF